MTELVLPDKADTAGLASITQAVVAASIWASGIKITLDSVEEPALKGDKPANGGAEIIAALAPDLGDGAKKIASFNQATAPFLKENAKLDAAVSAKLAEDLPEGVSAASVALFGGLHGLVSARGKMAISLEAPLLMWYTQFSNNSRVKSALATVAGVDYSRPASNRVPSGRVPQKPVSDTKPVASKEPNTENSVEKLVDKPAQQHVEEKVGDSVYQPVKTPDKKAASETPDDKAGEKPVENPSEIRSRSLNANDSGQPTKNTESRGAEAADELTKSLDSVSIGKLEEPTDPKQNAVSEPVVQEPIQTVESSKPDSGAAVDVQQVEAVALEDPAKESQHEKQIADSESTVAATLAKKDGTVNDDPNVSLPKGLAAAAALAPSAAKGSSMDGRDKIKSVDSVAFPKQSHPILPKEGQRNILVTSALPYVNNVPHLGNIIGSVLSADFYSRYSKARGYNTLFIGGTDEYGTATETKALEEGVSPMELCTKYYTIHRDIYEWFQIGFDHFGRTSTPQQTEIVQDVFLKLDKNGFLEEHSTEQLYCTVHDGYLADRFVEGTCPKCGYEDARGDQCDSCGQLLDPFELINPRCKLDNSTPVKRETNHIFLKLDDLQPRLEKWINKSSEKGNWSKNGRSITQNWLRDGLRARAITRDLSWGTPVPKKGYENKVVYVWFEAVFGYPSITALYTDEWKQWWRNPDNVELYQFMGKDNVPFHTVIFPASEMGTGDPWTLLHHLSTTEYLQYEGGKFSKSRNLGVFGNNARDVGLSPSIWRYYLATARPETADTQFSWQDFVMRNNNELLANLGNFVNRVIKFTAAKYESVVPDFQTSDSPSYSEYLEEANQILSSYNKAMEAVSLREGLEFAMRLSARGNQFLQDNKLDNTLFAEHPAQCAAVIGVALNLIYVLSSLIGPFMPETATKIEQQLEVPARLIPDELDLTIVGGHKIGKAQYLFSRIDSAKVAEWQSQFGGDQKAKAEDEAAAKAKKAKKDKKKKSKK